MQDKVKSIDRRDTIAALSSAPGRGGVAVIRVSGPDARAAALGVFKPAGGKDLEDRMMTYGKIVDPKEGREIDRVLCVYMKAPSTFTGEDTCEIYCHGGPVPVAKTLDLLYDAGARAAEPGEFSRRAFLSGRMDLTQAEAIMDMIYARAERPYAQAFSQLGGSLSGEIGTLRKKLEDILVNLTVNIDYPDEDIEQIEYDKLEEAIAEAGSEIDGLLKNADSGRMLREGLRVTILGKPNVGKSSLMNKVLREDRAIVTDIPGTTRDTIEESVEIRGIPVVLTDTAGVRETEDQVEAIGVEKTKLAIDSADVVLLVLDQSRDADEEDRKLIELAEQSPGRVLAVLNKTDLPHLLEASDIKGLNAIAVVETSMKDGTGIENLKDEIIGSAGLAEGDLAGEVMITNARHRSLLQAARASLSDASALTASAEPLEIIEIDVNKAYEDLGEILGETARADIIDKVFEKFCLGK